MARMGSMKRVLFISTATFRLTAPSIYSRDALKYINIRRCFTNFSGLPREFVGGGSSWGN